MGMKKTSDRLKVMKGSQRSNIVYPVVDEPVGSRNVNYVPNMRRTREVSRKKLKAYQL